MKWNEWESIRSPQNEPENLGLYLGAEIKTNFWGSSHAYIEPNLHVGLALYNKKERAKLVGGFLQWGIGTDLLENNSTGVYGILQLGIRYRISQKVSGI